MKFGKPIKEYWVGNHLYALWDNYGISFDSDDYILDIVSYRNRRLFFFWKRKQFVQIIATFKIKLK